ncbi:hypothetical protein DN752_12130 [Echinicola strongylocentroti]|uniref:SGNH/GDSL hydrolase family protein n=1 Tax=Echinicola strongylocentroti TaxID=1795355 RepID=A0A2Z4II57_9BACT|nr:hypothetical protein [Echinicola strongylocentroti]AWW30811.1 hypothetical protein DN752_12130 [Echinicola strongylocentroti]
MNRFLLNIIAFAIPLGLIFFPMEIYLRDNIYQAKSDYLTAHKDEIEALIMGPSYTWRGIDPLELEIPTASLAHEASAINTNLMLFDKYGPSLPKLNYVLFDLSLGYMENDNDQKWESNHLFNIYYGIKNYPSEIKNNFLLTANFKFYVKLFCAYMEDEENIERFNESGFVYKVSTYNNLFRSFEYDTVQLKASGELFKRLVYQNTIHDDYYQKNERLLKEMVATCKERGIQVIFVSPPKFHLNNEAATEEIKARREQFLSQFEKDEDVWFWNYEHLLEDNPHYFLDNTHLNPKGAEIFTEIINKRLLERTVPQQQASLLTSGY